VGNYSGSSLHIAESDVELVGVFSHCFVYQDNDGVPGFQYVLGGVLICPLIGSSKNDCIVSFTAFSSWSWAAVQISTYACPSGYPANCTVTVLTLATTGSNAGYVTITVTLSSLPVFVDGVLITPNKLKIALLINYPWSSLFPNPGGNLYLGVLGVGAGKTSSAVANIGFENGVPSSVDFVSSNGKTTGSFTWESECNSTTTTTTTAAIVTQSYTDATISNYISTCNPNCNIVILAIDVIINLYAAFGWRFNFIFFSIPVNQPTSISWDPTTTVQGGSSMGVQTAPIFWLTVCMVLAHLWWSRKHM